MRKIFIASHGKLASGMKSSLDVLLGSSDNVIVFDAYLNEENVKDKIEQFYETLVEGDQVILMSDYLGGSVSQVTFQYVNRPDTFVISGINLAVVLEIVAASDFMLTREELENIITESRKNLSLVLPEIFEGSAEQEEFF